MDLQVELTRILATLHAAGIDHALCGGLAVAIHGAPRATKDIDLLVQEADVERILEAVRAVGYTFRAAPMRFPDGMRIQRVSRVADGAVLTVDLLLVDENTRPAWESRVNFRTEEGDVCVVGREALMAMKAWAGRPQDLYDIQRLQGDDR